MVLPISHELGQVAETDQLNRGQGSARFLLNRSDAVAKAVQAIGLIDSFGKAL